MSIETEVMVTLAEVEVTDEYQVELRTHRKVTDLTPDEAIQLAGELMVAAVEAHRAQKADIESRHVDAHGFDIDTPPAAEAGEQ